MGYLLNQRLPSIHSLLLDLPVNSNPVAPVDKVHLPSINSLLNKSGVDYNSRPLLQPAFISSNKSTNSVSNPYISPVSSPSSSSKYSSPEHDHDVTGQSRASLSEVKAESDTNSVQDDDSDASHEEEYSRKRSLDDDKPKWKPRKKRQCPECKLYFSNLATHKSTHLQSDSRPHICEYCSRGFARPNDLFRHIKCHWKETGSDKGQFKCPYKDHESGDHCGHNSGIFSRCDTFKNHLKAIHFQYPPGTKKNQRANASGNCRMCNHQFSSVDDWLVNHLENNQCPYANELKKN